MKTKITLTRQNGNIFNLMAIASKAMKKDGRDDEAQEMLDKIFLSHSYHQALEIIADYCEIE